MMGENKVNKLETLNTNIATLHSKDVAEMTGKDHSKLLRDIRNYIKVLNESNYGSVEFFIESTYVDSKGETRPCYLLTRKGCDMVANKLTGEKGILFTAKYVTKFEEMEKELAFGKFKLPTTYKEALLALVAAEEEKELLIAQNKEKEELLIEQSPKVDLYEDFISTDNLYSVGEIAKTLAIKEMGKNNLYKYLRWNKIFMEGYEAYQRYVKSGHIVHRNRTYTYGKGENAKTKTEICGYFTPKGVEYLYKKLKRDGYKTPKTLEKVVEELKPTTDKIK
mgnify:FL=1